MTINLRAKNRKQRQRDQLKYALNYRVYADGREVTGDCFYYDGRRRIVGVYLQNEKGQHYTVGNELATQFLKPRRVRLVKNCGARSRLL